MKAKKVTKKLSLNKKTIANLDGITMRRVVGGFPNSLPFECGPNSEITSCTLLDCLYTRSCEVCPSIKICREEGTGSQETDCC